MMSSNVSHVRFQGVQVLRFPTVEGDGAFESRKAAMTRLAQETCQSVASLNGSLTKYAAQPTLCVTVQPDAGTIHIVYSDLFKNLLKGPLERLSKQVAQLLGKPVGQEGHPLHDFHMPAQLQAVQDALIKTQRLTPTMGNTPAEGSPVTYRLVGGQTQPQEIFYVPK